MNGIRPINEIAREQGRRVEEQQVGIIRAVLRQMCHGEDLEYSMPDYWNRSGRLKAFDVLPREGKPGYREFLLDDKPFLRFHAAEVNVEATGPQHVMHVTQRYEVLS